MTETRHELEPVASDFRETIERAAAERERVAEVARRAAETGLRNVWFVGCGGSHYAQSPAQYLLAQRATSITSFRVNSNEFNHLRPAHCGPESLVVLGSHSGTTPETLQAAETARSLGVRTVVAMTRSEESALAGAADVAFTYGSKDTVWEPKQLYFGLLAHNLLRAVGDEPEEAFDTAVTGYLALPDALLQAIKEQDDASAEIASALATEPITYLLGSGPVEDVARCLAMCYLQEMQWLHAAAFNAGEFFHGAFEVVTDDVPVIAFLGEDSSRPVAERAGRFIKKYSKKAYLIDSTELSLPGVPPAVRGEIAPIALGTLVSRLAQHYESVTGHLLKTRRYMFQVEY